MLRISMAALSDGDGESSPNFDGTEEGHGPYRAAWEMPLLSNEAGSGASRTESPLMFTGDKPDRTGSDHRRGGHCHKVGFDE